MAGIVKNDDLVVGCGSGRAPHETVKGRSRHRYRIVETEPFARGLKKIAIRPRGHRTEAANGRVSATHPPSHDGPHIRKLKHDAPETWRHRIGAWRVFYCYEIADDKRTRCS